ncbi:MAG: hypothetical protein NTZ05_10325 [Chloroflexi bacterium]|nr:hypothetical protein [Chloroflexota bacterium]
MNLIVIGGGHFGSFHARQLHKAMRRGKIPVQPIIIVDRDPDCAATREFAGADGIAFAFSDWHAYLCARFPDGDTNGEDHIVPAPFAPHLMYDWLAAAVTAERPGVRLRRGLFDVPLGLPYELTHEGNRFISAADWICPAACIEPANCPAIRGPRTWELGDIVRSHATPGNGLSAVEVFTCKHYAYGVGTIPAARLLDARRNVLATLDRSEAGVRVAVATVSSCHGVVAVLETVQKAEESPEG